MLKIMLGCLNANLSMNDKQIVNFFILEKNNEQSTDKTIVASLKF